MPLCDLAELVRRETGIVAAEGKASGLREALRRAAPGLEPDAFLRAMSDPAEGKHLFDRLIDEVTVQETSFVRDRGQLEGIGWRDIFAGTREAGSREIRVWSVGCATGEEPYTLALLAAEAFAPGRPPVDVLGTDISAAALAAAAAGLYRERAVRALDAGLRQRYLVPRTDGTYLVGDRLRQVVRFRRHNLIRDPVPPLGEAGFDIITCRNVLIYFETPVAERIVARLDRSLRPGGKLLLGAADALQRTVRVVPPRERTGPPESRGRPARRPLDRQPGERGERLATALAAAGRGNHDQALAQLAALVISDPLDADAQFAHGLVMLEGGDPDRAVAAFRGALFAEPEFALAAFTLGCAYDGLGDHAAARRAYERALRTLSPDDDRHELLLRQIDIGDIAAACRMRLKWHGKHSQG